MKQEVKRSKMKINEIGKLTDENPGKIRKAAQAGIRTKCQAVDGSVVICG